MKNILLFPVRVLGFLLAIPLVFAVALVVGFLAAIDAFIYAWKEELF